MFFRHRSLDVFLNAHLIAQISQPSPEEKKNKFDQFFIYIMKMHTEMTVQRLTARGVASMNAGHVSLPFALEFR